MSRSTEGPSLWFLYSYSFFLSALAELIGASVTRKRPISIYSTHLPTPEKMYDSIFGVILEKRDGSWRFKDTPQYCIGGRTRSTCQEQIQALPAFVTDLCRDLVLDNLLGEPILDTMKDFAANLLCQTHKPLIHPIANQWISEYTVEIELVSDIEDSEEDSEEGGSEEEWKEEGWSEEEWREEEESGEEDLEEDKDDRSKIRDRTTLLRERNAGEINEKLTAAAKDGSIGIEVANEAPISQQTTALTYPNLCQHNIAINTTAPLMSIETFTPVFTFSPSGLGRKHYQKRVRTARDLFKDPPRIPPAENLRRVFGSPESNAAARSDNRNSMLTSTTKKTESDEQSTNSGDEVGSQPQELNLAKDSDMVVISEPAISTVPEPANAVLDTLYSRWTLWLSFRTPREHLDYKVKRYLFEPRTNRACRWDIIRRFNGALACCICILLVCVSHGLPSAFLFSVFIAAMV